MLSYILRPVIPVFHPWLTYQHTRQHLYPFLIYTVAHITHTASPDKPETLTDT